MFLCHVRKASWIELKHWHKASSRYPMKTSTRPHKRMQWTLPTQSTLKDIPTNRVESNIHALLVGNLLQLLLQIAGGVVRLRRLSALQGHISPHFLPQQWPAYSVMKEMYARTGFQTRQDKCGLFMQCYSTCWPQPCTTLALRTWEAISTAARPTAPAAAVTSTVSL